jgi:transcriptional regulator GlxA family with amidase domain
VHGACADGSSWNKVIPILEAEGFAVTAVQNPLKSLADDVVTTKRGLESWQKLRIKEMLHAHLEENTTIKELATACSLSASHFGRCFRQSFGTSVHQHLIQLRIDKAKDLLSQTNKTLVEIALLSGFYDQAAFSRTFSRIEHMTPSRWRRFNRDGIRTPRRNEIFSGFDGWK